MQKTIPIVLGVPLLLLALPVRGTVYEAEASNAAAIQAALWCVAMDVATNREPGEVVVPAGVYEISEPFRIYPNTTLTLDEDAVVRYKGDLGGFMLLGGHLNEDGRPCSGDGCRHGGYTQCHDVVVQGGFWNRNASSSDEVGQAFLFRHASGIAIRDLSVANCSSHHVNVSGSENVVVDNVYFTGAVRYTGNSPDFWGDWTPGDAGRYSSIEAVHMDYLDKIGEAGVQPLDLTPCRNILVTNCVFDAVFAGAGVHHLPLGDRASNIRVVDCCFVNIFSYASYLFDVENATIENNTMEGGIGLLYSNHSSFRAAGNDVTGLRQEGVYACNGSNATIDWNVFENTGLRAILACEGTALTATRNTIRETGDNAILLNGCAESVVDGNTVSGAGKIGILAMDKTPLHARDNTIDSPGTHGIATSGGASLNAARNTIRSPGKNGFVLNAGTATLSDNTIASAGLHGIYAESSARLTASGNTIRSVAKSGFAISGATATLSGNKIHSAGLHGISGDVSAKISASSNTIESPASCGFSCQGKARLSTGGGNVVKNPGKQGVFLSSAGASTIAGVQVSGSGSDGIRVVKTDGCTVSGNTVSGVKDKKAGIVMEQCRSGTVTGNTVSNSTGHGIRVFGTKAVPCTVTVSKNKATGAASVYFDIMLGEWSRKCNVVGNTLGNKRFKIAPTGTGGNVYRPLGTSLSKLAKKTKTSMVVKWAAQPQAGGFEIQYSTSKKFAKAKTAAVAAGKTSRTVKKLVAGKKYWVRIRTFHTVDKKKYYSSWSAAKAVKL